MKNEHFGIENFFGLDKKFRLMFDISRILNETPAYWTTTELTERIGYASVGLIQQTCHELKDLIEMVYYPDQCQLIISQRYGVKLSRHNANLNELFKESLFLQPSYQLMMALLNKREIPSYPFYEEIHISESTLRRKIRSLNQFLSYYLKLETSKTRLNP